MSRVSRSLYLAAGSALLIGVTAIPAQAGTLDFSAYGWMATFDDNIDLTVLSADSGGVVLSLQKFADFTDGPNGSGVIEPLSIVFRQTSVNAVARIAIEEEIVLNDTGVTWTGFQFGLASNTSSNVSFDAAASADFSTNPFDTKTFNDDNTNLTVTGGTLSSGNFPDNLWQPGKTAGALYINANPFSSGSLLQSFVFNEQPISGGPGPIIPLPPGAYVTLAGLGAVAFKLTRKRVL